MAKKKRPVDVEVENHGNLFVFRLLSDASFAWVLEHVHSESWQWLGKNALAVDHHYVGALAAGLRAEGFEVR